MTTKRDAAARVMYVARQISHALEGDEDADFWIVLLENIAYDLEAERWL